MDHAQQCALWEQWTPLAKKLAWEAISKRHLPRRVWDDVDQEALLALWRAVRGWRPDGGAAFNTYAWLSIRRGIKDALDRKKYLPEKELEIHYDYNVPDERRVIDIDAADEVENCLEVLPVPWRKIVVAYCLGEQNLRDTAVQFGVSKERIRQIVNLSIEKLQRRKGGKT